MRKWLLFGIFLLFLFLPACAQSSPRDFYSCTINEGPVCTIWLGMTSDEVTSAISVNSNFYNDKTRTDIIRFKWQDDILASFSCDSQRYQPVGIPFSSTRDEVLAHYAKDPAVTVAEQPNLLIASKTIDGTVYYVRYVLYGDNTIKEITVATDLTLDPPQMPK